MSVIAIGAVLMLLVGLFLKVWVARQSPVFGKWVITPVGLEPHSKASNRLLQIGTILSGIWILVRFF